MKQMLFPYEIVEKIILYLPYDKIIKLDPDLAKRHRIFQIFPEDYQPSGHINLDRYYSSRNKYFLNSCIL